MTYFHVLLRERMYVLTYTSIAKPNLTQEEISDLLNTARGYNMNADITGCLLYHQGIFIQAIEGDQKEVSDLFIKISKDKRHTDVLIVDESHGQVRNFENWRMAYKEFEDEELKLIGNAMSLKDFDSFSTLSGEPPSSIRSFWTMARQLISF